ncbi:hypothetical protein NEMBOFW57_008450 [Staphylotrichum longicolle]|uniref:DUF7820 domain-containing protein n=1 Tax=Staphylotrichum longicolle TaxID=669026 RepID=A0AAD4EV68_9PEZI|nr:hypothetical protein NEMBOFW57_008450 [Staphylotrichum longicolle]
MEPSGDKAGDLGRRVSTRASVRVSVDNGDDEYELALAGMVADGFRPSHAGGPGEPSTPSLTSASSATLYAEDSPSPSQSTPRTGRPSSTSKPPNPQYVLSVRPEPNQLARQTTNSTDSTLFLPAEGPSDDGNSLGFRGLPDQYQRRVGPEGEEIADMIGPDGHTEQLPLTPGIRMRPTLAKRQLWTALLLKGAEVPRSFHPFTSDDSGRQIRLTDGEVSEKRQPQKKWQVWMRRKLWGIFPYWAICLTGLVLLVMVIILGAVVGTVMGKQKRPPRKEGAWEPSSFDTTPIPTPSDLQPLPTGTFAMPLLPNRVSSTCFQNPTLSQAWNCNLVISGMHLTVLKEGNEYRASLDCNRSYTLMNNVYSYGEQPPLIEKPVTLDLVGDKFEPSRGPAWFKMLTYNKTVIVPEGVLGSSSGSANAQQVARHAGAVNSGISNFKRMGILKRGEKPWPYPRVIKLEERRISTADAPRAQCTQVEIQGPRQEAKVLLDPEGKPIVIDIEETGPFIMSGAPTPTATAGVARRDETYYQDFGEGVFARGEGSGSAGVPDISPCGCMWYLT